LQIITETFMNKHQSTRLTTLVAAAFAFAPALAQAHPGHAPGANFTHGFVHPMMGLDHVLAMVAVGLWAAQLGGRAAWLVPAAFVSVMTAGAGLGMSGVHLPFVEQGIFASVLVLGLLIATAARLPLAASAAIVGVFALFHGVAHGTEMPASVSGLAYAAGFALATAILHGVGLLVAKSTRVEWVRFAGAAIAVTALGLIW
jgi:urease accessory protein